MASGAAMVRPSAAQISRERVAGTVSDGFQHEIRVQRPVVRAAHHGTQEDGPERGVVDVIGTVGYYSLVSLLLNVDEYPMPEGVEEELQPLE